MRNCGLSLCEIKEILEAVRLRRRLTNKALAKRFGKSESSIAGLIARTVRISASDGQNQTVIST